MLKIIALVAVVLLVALLVFAATKPDTFRVQRSANINAPSEKIFALIDDYRSWGSWSPWEKKDPAMKRTYSGAASGKGAVYAWEGNKDVGQGRMEIAESVPPSKVTIKLDSIKPFEAHNIVEFTLEPQGDATNIRWAMQGHTSYFAKIIHVFFDMDSMVGKDFETGLANLKAIAEK
jgi:cellulose synthase/poly-beta-1,6-N-acetylglucosamine synthase-like glycosyltransferase